MPHIQNGIKKKSDYQELNLIQIPGLRDNKNIDLSSQKMLSPKKQSQDGTHDYHALSDYVDPDVSNVFGPTTKDATGLLAQNELIDETFKLRNGKTHAQNLIKLKALKLMDVYKQLQQAVFQTKKSPYDSFTVAPIVNQSQKSPQDAVKKLLNQQPFQLAADNILLDQKMLSDESLTDVINSPQVHILSALAIAEDNQEIFKRIVRFLSIKGWELPRYNGIYDQVEWDKVKSSRSKFLHGLISEALQAAIQMDWLLLCEKIISYAAKQQFFLSITSESVSALIENEAYDLMINLLANNVFLAKRRNNPFKESDKPNSPPQASITQLGQDAPYLNLKIDRTWLNDIQLKKAQESPFASQNFMQSPRQLAVKEFQEDFDVLEQIVEPQKDQDLVKMLLQQKKPRTQAAKNLLQGETIFQPQHIFEQLFIDKPEIARQDMPKQIKQPLYTLIAKLSGTQKFAEFVHVMILNGNREAIYSILQSKLPDLDKQKKKDTHIQNEEVGADPVDGTIQILDKNIREAIAVEMFSFSVSQEQLDEAINVFLKFQGVLKENARRCIGDILRGINFSAAFFELKLYLLAQFLTKIQRHEIFSFIECMDTKIIADFSPFQSHRALLLQNLNPLLVALQTMTILKKLKQIEPSCNQRVQLMINTLDRKVAQILESQPADQIRPLEEMIWLKDIFDKNIVYYLQELKPSEILNTQFCDKILNNLWSSSFQTNNGSFLNYSTGYQIVKNQYVTMNACTPSIRYVCLRKTADQQIRIKFPLHQFTLPVWLTCASQRFFIDFIITLAFTIVAQIYLFRFNQNFETIQDIFKATIDSSKPINLGSFYQTKNGKMIQMIFIETIILICCGILVAIQTPCNQLLRYLYVKHTNTKVKSFNFDLCDLILFLASITASSVVVISILTQVEVPRTDLATKVTYDMRLVLNMAKHLLSDRRYEVFPISVAIMVASMWIKLILMLRVTNYLGQTILTIGNMVKSIILYVIIWLVSVLIFCSVIFMLYTDKLADQDAYGLIINFFESTAGNWEQGFPIYDNARLQPNVGKTLHMIFILINFIGCFSILTVVFTHSYSRYQSQKRASFNGYRIDLLPSSKYDDAWGWMIISPQIFSPFLLIFVYPLMVMVSKCTKALHLQTVHLLRLFFTPLALIYLTAFTAANVALSPVAYISVIIQAAKLNFNQERFDRTLSIRVQNEQQQTKVAMIAGWIFIGPIILLLGIFFDSAFFMYYLYKPAGQHIYYTDIEQQLKLQTQQETDIYKDFSLLIKEGMLPLNLPGYQTLYKVVAMQVVQTVYNPQTGGVKKYKMSIKTVVQEVRRLLEIGTCVQMLLFGDIDFDVARKISFIGGLLSERQSEAGRLKALRMLKSLVAKFKVDQDFMPKIILRNHELRGGLLWQMLKEKKMRVLGKIYQQQHQQGLNLSYVDFMALKRDQTIEDDIREICVACPTTVLQILRKECKEESQDRFNSELTRIQTKILKQQQIQILQSQVKKVVGPSKPTQNDDSKFLNKRIHSEDLQPRASLDPAARLDLYHGTLAQQELIYTDISNMEIPNELAQIYSYRLNKPLDEVDLAALIKPVQPVEQPQAEKITPKLNKNQEKQKKNQTTPQAKKGSKSTGKSQSSKSPGAKKKK